jgi:hypothetical protein
MVEEASLISIITVSKPVVKVTISESLGAEPEPPSL